ncbi:putative bifunctional diguanylate cyclase/phosphodiesterase [Desulfovibrio sp. TomC]|uniref:putative bifunctional diguanylate cyclase/phosphodiesterase n=1 Tax=Desulfovibrio sp. TomC TaxID=1562888 RepID=UPI0005751B0D|nr:bifunctional diguanylate cyclase/phosphodiesterase [Desulfovibrio sp. TomC]KHK02206.1 diguanylate cyclase/phosphodiesterase (GGDEF & EAL domains) with PAS/PAC sensor(s) [Desulfovibrio sp. TomC]
MLPDIHDLLESLPSHAAVLDRAGLLVASNTACLELLREIDPDMGPGRPFGASCAKMLTQPVGAAVQEGISAVLDGSLPRYEMDLPCGCVSAQTWRALCITPLHGAFPGALVTLADISRQKQLEEHILHDAFHDTLTGLFNRALFINRLDQAIKRLKRSPKALYAVLYLDMDRFKLVNKTFGHVTGDRLLMVIANRLQKQLRELDTLARFGGDEFAILIEDIAGLEDACSMAETVLRQLAQSFRLKKQEIFVTCSIGVVLGSAAYEHPDQVLRDADNAMYSSKEHGGDHYTVFDAGMRVLTQRRMEMELALRHAMESGEITVHYQPIVSLTSGEVTGFEALARWQHPRQGLIAPSEFIPIAEETGLINELGALILRQSCRRLVELLRANPDCGDLTLSVNISGRQFKRPDFVDEVAAILAETGINTQLVKLELTESVLMDDADEAVRTIKRLKALGVKVVIDDFGTGYSSLSYIQRFPFDSLKVDRSFVGNMNEAEQNMEIVRAIIAMAHKLGLEVVAEGVELAEHRTALSELRCESAQGFFFSKPVPGEELDLLMRKHWKDDATSRL